MFATAVGRDDVGESLSTLVSIHFVQSIYKYVWRGSYTSFIGHQFTYATIAAIGSPSRRLEADHVVVVRLLSAVEKDSKLPLHTTISRAAMEERILLSELLLTRQLSTWFPT